MLEENCFTVKMNESTATIGLLEDFKTETSVIGVSRTLSGPYLSSKPFVICKKKTWKSFRNWHHLPRCLKQTKNKNKNYKPCMHLDIPQPTTKEEVLEKEATKKEENAIHWKCYLFTHHKDRRISRHFFI